MDDVKREGQRSRPHRVGDRAMNLPDRTKPLLLVAEDDPDDRVLVEEALRPLEDLIRLCFVEDGEKLVVRLRHAPDDPKPRLVLLNLNMPVKNGLQALTEIREDPELKQVPIVIWTTSSDDQERRWCLDAGAAEFVTKPNSFEEFASALRELTRTWLRLEGPFTGDFDDPHLLPPAPPSPRHGRPRGGPSDDKQH